MITLTCEHCGTEFRLQKGHYDSRTRAVGHPPKYCSRFCMGAANQVPEVLRTCEHCGTQFVYQPGRRATGTPRHRGERFCSQECRAGAKSAECADPDMPGYTKGRGRNSSGYITRRPVGGGPRVLEHIVVMELHLGRKLLPSEEVHHRFGDRTDNALGRLELWDTSHPAGQRVEDKIEFYQDFLMRHGFRVNENARCPATLEVTDVYFQI